MVGVVLRASCLGFKYTVIILTDAGPTAELVMD